MPPRAPAVVRTTLIAWTACWLLVVAIACVPAYRPPWSASLRVSAAAPGVLGSGALAPFTTPYVSFVTVRLSSTVQVHDLRVVLLDGGEPIVTGAALAARTLVVLPLHPSASSRPGEYVWLGAATQFNPSSALSVALLTDGSASDLATPGAPPPGAAVTIGYDGRSTAVAVVHYWWPWMLAAFLCGAAAIALPATWRLQARTAASWQQALAGHRSLIALLAVAAGIRLLLVFRGGQYFDWDENRYLWGLRLFDLAGTGNVRPALDLLLNSPDHPAFRLVSAGLGFLQVLSAWATGHPIADARAFAGEWLPASVLSMASVASIALVYGIARRGGATRRESGLAAFLLAVSSAMLMHARHFFPYDAAMATLLLALWIGVEDGEHPARSYAAGAIAGFGFLIYTGYWLLATVVALVHLLRRPLGIGTLARRTAWFALGGASVTGALIAAGSMAGRPFLAAFVDTSRGILNGDFSEGWSLPWAFFWNVDGGVLLVYAAGIVGAVAAAVAAGWRRAACELRWLWCAAAVYGGLAAGAHALHQFMVYDRLARQMLPFMCLAAAGGLARLEGWRVGRTSALRLVQGALIILFAVNVWPFLAQRFPRELVRDAIRTHGEAAVRLDTTVLHSVDATVGLFLPEGLNASEPPKRYVLLNAKDIWTDDKLPGWKPPPRGRVLFRTPHPRQLRALQYQGYTPGQRLLLRHIDFSMQLIDTEQPP